MKKSTSKGKASKAPAGVAKGSSKNIDLERVRDFTDFMKANDLVELEFKNGATEVRLRRFEGSVAAAAPAVLASSAPQAAPALAAAAPAPAPGRKFHIITSPFVGTFYRSAGPNQDSFVDEGKTVSVGDTLCIVEAMKLMNEIESDMKGRVVKILVNNATPVEFGEALFEIEPL